MPKPRAIQNFGRQRPTRKPRDTVLIVCEGSKTEPNYFDEIITDLQLSSTDVQIYGRECGSDPMTVVSYALEVNRDTPKGFDYVFCVIDRDRHDNFQPAVNRVNGTRLRGVKDFKIIWSDPCFEYWLLLHFGYTARPYTETRGLSRCAACIRDLENHISDYSKGVKGAYKRTKKDYEAAVQNAIRRKAESEAQDASNPSTLVHELTELLISIAENAKPAR